MTWVACRCYLSLSQVCCGIYPKRVTGVMHLQHKDKWYHSNNNHYIIGPKLKRTSSLLKHHRSLWLDFFFFFSPGDASFVKLKAALALEVTTSFAAEKKLAASHFHTLCYDTCKCWNSYRFKWRAILKNYNW